MFIVDSLANKGFLTAFFPEGSTIRHILWNSRTDYSLISRVTARCI